jgi:PHP family Zn ribbon phosphoesterase
LWLGLLFVPAISADLHLHTVLSPCAEVEMIPPLIVRRALELGLNLLAVTDHNAVANCAGVMTAAQGTGLVILPGMELQTVEEVHMLCLFKTLEQALTWQGIVFDHLPDLPNDEDHFGGQYVVDGEGDYIRTESRLLATSTDLSVDEAARRVTVLGGLPIPAHIDRAMFSLIANLGFVPSNLQVPALEIFRLNEPETLARQHPEVARYPLVRDSDAHQLSDMRRGITFEAEIASFEALRQALQARIVRLCPQLQL